MSGGRGAAILAPEGLRLTGAERRFFADADPFGFILFTRNLETPDQIRALTSDLREVVGWHAPIFIDQEGGRVQRLRPPLATEWLPPLDDVSRYGADAPRAMWLRYRITAAELLGLGIDGNCAPMLDVARPQTHRFLRNRCYGETPERVAEIGVAVAQGLMQGGVLPVIKHLPGHGLAQLDSHLDLPRIDAPRDELDRIDFEAFRPFHEMPLGMTAHLVFEGLNTEPATIDPAMIRLIREDIGFTGFLMTDDISMEALSGSVAERGEAALAAGCDCVLHCNGEMDEMVALMRRAGEMSEPARARAEAALASRTIPAEVDLAELHAEREALLNGHR
ncbi:MULTISPECIES: glycoside hydrolase family 3 N-terminal domain-containing protein [Salipiger]|uniref:beta-N-acetylhexosaminidase n=1 Tax=Salipiger profundus TaxID=1229727 RepID=A0A1U7D900_9RHOB|nr:MULTISPECIES: glycoside hydrolase family 3 N-terminal domain-containing protein [Salipiger]APX24609.1 beta-N-acetylhexosaminidase [Salipiger profundus]GFZ96510.1 beta-N-acetylhexosaminidase [Salipiger profundus]SFB81593.1 beta-N-acetylhexosaminidase [Salipiger profundus]